MFDVDHDDIRVNHTANSILMQVRVRVMYVVMQCGRDIGRCVCSLVNAMYMRTNLNLI